MKVKIPKYNKSDTRKVEVNIDSFDTWSLDHTLAYIILPALLQLKDTAHGVPSDFADAGGASWDSQDSFDFYKDTHEESFEIRCRDWNTILDKMIWSFKEIAFQDYENLYHHGTPKFEWEKTGEQILNPANGKMEDVFQMVDKNPGEHWYDHVGAAMHRERIQEGLDLFAKYYLNLWD